MAKAAFIFPGQGSQHVGMGRDLYEKYGVAREVIDSAGRVLGIDMAGLCFSGPGDELKRTVNAQPAILTISVAILAVLREKGIGPAVAAGHSLGEYSALVAAGSLDFEDALRLVRLRGQFMQEAVPLGEGGMMAVLGMDAAAVLQVCALVSDEGGMVEAVNFNCPGQLVIAGDSRSLDRASELLKQKGGRKCLPLSVSAPFHSSLMRPAGERLADSLAGVRVKDPEIPVLSNVTADYHGGVDNIKDLLVRQVYSPVRWEECVQLIIRDGFGPFVEVGPGRVLSGLVGKINKDVEIFNVEDGESLETVLAGFGEVG